MSTEKEPVTSKEAAAGKAAASGTPSGGTPAPSNAPASAPATASAASGAASAHMNDRMYVHRRFTVRFLVVLLAILSVLSFVVIAMGWGTAGEPTGREDSGTPTKLADTSPFYVLLIGSDSLVGTALYTGDVNTQSEEDAPQADSLLLVRVDPGDCVLTFVTVPSNTMLEGDDVPLRDTLKMGDTSQTVRSVERITGVSIRYYFEVGFSAFEQIVDKIGGSVQDVRVSIKMQDPVTAKTVNVPSGSEVSLDSAQTLAYLRSWSQYATDGDAHRQLNVRNVMQNLVNAVLDSDDEQVRLVLGTFEGIASTNIDDETLLSLVTRFYDEREKVTMYACTGPYLSTTINDEGYTVVEPRVSAWRELMSVVDAGEDPAAAFPQYDFTDSEDDYVQTDDSDTEDSDKASTSKKSSKSSSSSAKKSASTDKASSSTGATKSGKSTSESSASASDGKNG